MSKKLSAAKAREFLVRAVTLVNAMANEGVGYGGMEDPQDFMSELADALDVSQDTNIWDEAVRVLSEPSSGGFIVRKPSLIDWFAP